ncbi:MAG: YbaK/EbsC family protein [Candidatus Glassbacteria bacterium]|nr:YbaK/EbsC family protein [Candidatus Glassbacteria bacterium]
MTVSSRLSQYLKENKVGYEVVPHNVTYSAQHTAASVHAPGREVAKVVVIKGGGEYVMAVVDAPHQVNLKKFAAVSGMKDPAVAGEAELKELFPECELGAMPPFGVLYGLKVYVDRQLDEDEEIIFNAGTHFEVVRMKYADFKNLAQPTLGDFAG